MTISDPIVTRFFRWASDEPGRRLRNPLPSPMARLTFWTVNRMRLNNYEARHAPLPLHLRVSWFTLLFWQNLLEEHKPEPWAPAIIQVDLRETVKV